jgi:hypothetical protein
MGLFGMDTPGEMLNKLEKEYRELCANPNDRDVAMNFFVTANHIPDYVFPKSKSEQATMRRSNTALAACEYVANEGKHSFVGNNKITAVSHTELKGAAFDFSSFDSSAFHTGVPTVHLKDEAATELGPEISALQLAEKVLSFWRTELVSK